MRFSWWWGLLDLMMRVVGNILQAKDRSQVLRVESFEESVNLQTDITAGYLQRRRGRKKGLVGSPPSKKPMQYWKEIWRQIEAAPPLYTVKRDPPKSS